MHLFADGYVGVHGSSPAEGDELAAYEALRRQTGIERALLLGYEGEPPYRGNNAHVLALARTRSWLTPLVYLPVSSPPSARALQEFRAAGARGFVLFAYGEAEAAALGAWPAASLAEIRDQQAIISFNADIPAIAALAPAVGELYGCPLLFSHLGEPGRFASAPTSAEARARLAPLIALAAHDDVHVKFSGLYGMCEPPDRFPHDPARPFVEVLLDEFGPSRLLWGSDFTPALDYLSFAQTTDVELLSSCSTSEVAQIMGGNLVRLLDAHSG
jgi:predicted TIM-barrel fold metal-dependent hydrolase